MLTRLFLNFVAVFVLTAVYILSKGKWFNYLTVSITLAILLLLCKPWHSDHLNPVLDFDKFLSGELTLAQWSILLVVQCSGAIAAYTLIK